MESLLNINSYKLIIIKTRWRCAMRKSEDIIIILMMMGGDCV